MCRQVFIKACPGSGWLQDIGKGKDAGYSVAERLKFNWFCDAAINPESLAFLQVFLIMSMGNGDDRNLGDFRS